LLTDLPSFDRLQWGILQFESLITHPQQSIAALLDHFHMDSSVFPYDRILPENRRRLELHGQEPRRSGPATLIVSKSFLWKRSVTWNCSSTPLGTCCGSLRALGLPIQQFFGYDLFHPEESDPPPAGLLCHSDSPDPCVGAAAALVQATANFEIKRCFKQQKQHVVPSA
jgi:hypothetical protein